MTMWSIVKIQQQLNLYNDKKQLKINTMKKKVKMSKYLIEIFESCITSPSQFQTLDWFDSFTILIGIRELCKLKVDAPVCKPFDLNENRFVR